MLCPSGYAQLLKAKTEHSLLCRPFPTCSSHGLWIMGSQRDPSCVLCCFTTPCTRARKWGNRLPERKATVGEFSGSQCCPWPPRLGAFQQLESCANSCEQEECTTGIQAGVSSSPGPDSPLGRVDICLGAPKLLESRAGVGSKQI